MSGTLAGTGGLVRLVLRRDRLVLPVWIAVAALVPLGLASGAGDLYPTAEALRQYADDAMSNPAQVAMRGIVYAPTLGGVTAWGAGMSSTLIFAIASLLIVIRHTRVEEETGRRELLGSTVVGRPASLTAVLAVVFASNLLAGLLLAGGLASTGLPPAGGFVLGLSAAGVGIASASVAAVAAQLTASAGTARGVAFGALGFLFLLRAAGDARGEAWPAWLSPFGWARLTRAYTGDRWWVLGLFAGLAGVVCAAAFALAGRRDLAAGLLPAQLGPPAGAPGLRTAFALAWRTHRASLLAWTAAYAVVGLLLGVATLGATDQLGGLFSGADALFTFSSLVLSQAAAGYAILTALRLRTEEQSGLAELLLATAPNRIRWVAAHLVFALLGPAVLLGAAGMFAGLAYGLATHAVGEQLPALLGSALLWLPAVWVVAAIALALQGFLPRLATAVSWALLVVFLLLELAFEFGQVSQALLDLSPFTHIPRVLLGVPLTPGPIVVLLALASALVAAGLAGIRRRDVG
ncbi:ABC transporter permease [Flindersiella endophytica]